jgi:hypothetical protein
MESKTVLKDATTSPSQTSKTVRVFVWSIWFAMVFTALVCIAKYGRNIPLAEDWVLVAPLTGQEPNLLSWLWAQNNEHRIPLPRIMLLALLKVTHGDFRVGMVFNVITLGMLAFAMIQLARQIRGKTDFADAFFPLILLHLGNWENLVWSWQLSFVVPVIIICGVLLVILNQPTLSTPNTAILAGVSLILLPLCGGTGILFMPFLLLWLCYCGLLHWKAAKNGSEQRWLGGFLLVNVAIALCILGLYFINYERPYWNPPSPGLGATLKTSGMFLALGFGPVAAKSWGLFIFIAFAILVPTLRVIILGVLRTQGIERYRALGLFLFFICLVLYALALGWGRSGLVPTAGMPMRYVLLAVPIFCTSFFIWELYGSYEFSKILQRGLLVIMCLLIPFNTKAGFQWRDWYLGGMQAIERDLLARTTSTLIAQRHKDFLVHWWDEKKLAAHIEMLHNAGIGPFTRIRKDSR